MNTPSRNPDKEGEMVGFVFQAYAEETPDGRDYYRVWLWRDGEHLPGKYVRTRHGRRRLKTKRYHTVYGELWAYLVRQYLKTHFEPPETFPHLRQLRAGDVDEMLRAQRRKERRRRTRKDAARFYGCATEHLSKAQVETYRNMGNRMARKSLAHQ